MAVYLFPVKAGNRIRSTQAHHFHLLAARGYQHFSWFYPIAVSGLLYLQPAEPVKTLGIHLGKALRHMLGNHNAGHVFRKLLEDLKRGLCPSRGCADSYDRGLQDGGVYGRQPGD